MQCALETKLENFVDRLASPSFNQGVSGQVSTFQPIQALPQYGTPQYQQYLQQYVPQFKEEAKPEIKEIPKFEESISSVLSLNGGDSKLGYMIGAALTGTVVGLVSRFVPIAGIPSGILGAVAGYILMSKVFKTGILHAISVGVMIGGGVSTIFPLINGVMGGFRLGGASSGSSSMTSGNIPTSTVA